MEGQTSCWTSDGKMSTFLENVDVGESESGESNSRTRSRNYIGFYFLTLHIPHLFQ